MKIGNRCCDSIEIGVSMLSVWSEMPAGMRNSAKPRSFGPSNRIGAWNALPTANIDEPVISV